MEAIKACEELSTENPQFDYKVLKLYEDFEPEDFSSQFPYDKTLPQIVVDEEHIGGWSEFEPFIRCYKLVSP
jgi:hypothetical protein